MSVTLLPYDCLDFDIIYSSIADVLKVEYPQNQDETLQSWYKRLLYELMKYVQEQYEPEETNDIIPAKNKNNKKKNNAPTPAITEPLFDNNIDSALEIISQDSKFAVYLLSWFLPILVKPTDRFEICLFLNNSNTPAEHVALQSVEFSLTSGMFQLNFNRINGTNIQDITKAQYNQWIHDPFMRALFEILHKTVKGDKFFSYESLKECTMIYYSGSYDLNSIQLWSFIVATFLWKLSELLKPLFVEEVVFKTNLEETIRLTKHGKEVPRKRFNARKYLNTETLTDDQVSAQILRTMFLSSFRTFYDYDKDVISDDLFNYLFKGARLTY